MRKLRQTEDKLQEVEAATEKNQVSWKDGRYWTFLCHRWTRHPIPFEQLRVCDRGVTDTLRCVGSNEQGRQKFTEEAEGIDNS